KRGAILRLNLLGLVNYISISSWIRKCVVVKDPGTGDLTIADSASGNRINAEVEPLRRSQALRKAMFESLLVTATYRVSKTVAMTGLSSHNFHFAANETTNAATVADYLRWFVGMKLLTKQQSADYLKLFAGSGPSTCLLRTEFDDAACESLFFAAPGKLWNRDRYLEFGRRAMQALIDPDNSDVDRVRYNLLDRHWAEAVEIGPNDNLAELMGLHLTDATGQRITPYLRGDVYTIDWWATAMQTAGEAILEMQQFLAGADASTLAESHEFAARRDQLQKKMADVIGKSQTRFDEPWGLISLFWAAGSTGASGRLVAAGLLVAKPE
ncbi:MAG TPA: hypothetical protein VGH38_09075, partial [Bryobacteraceae bacterium]